MRKVRVDGRTLDQIYGSHFPSFPSVLWDKLAFGNLGSTKSVSLEWNMIRLLKRKPFPRSIYTYTLLDDINLKHHKPLFQTKMGAVSHKKHRNRKYLHGEKCWPYGAVLDLALDSRWTRLEPWLRRKAHLRISPPFGVFRVVLGFPNKFVQGVNSSAFGINHHAWCLIQILLLNIPWKVMLTSLSWPFFYISLRPTLRIEAIRWFIPLHLMPESQLCTQDEYSGHPRCQSSCVTSETTNRKVRIWHKSHPSLSTTP